MKNLKDLKVVFFGTSAFAVPILISLIKESNVVAVVTQPDKLAGRKKELTASPVKFEIRNSKFEIPVLQFDSLKSPEVIEKLKELNADLFIVAAYGKIIPQAILDIPKFGCINVHGSILPKYRGASPIHAVLINGETETGNTVMIMDAKMDNGPVLASSIVPIEPADDFKSLETKMAEDGASLLVKTLNEYLNGDIEPKVQNIEEATFTKLINKEDGLIDWNGSAKEILNRWRAYKYWPGIFTFITDNNGTKIRIALDEISVADKIIDSKAGELAIRGGKLYFACPNDSIEVVKLTPEGKKTMTAKEFINGYGQKFSPR